MIRLGESRFWIDATAVGWVLVHAPMRKGKPTPVERFGPFTSPAHALQQRKVALPTEAKVDLLRFVRLIGAGDELVAETPQDGAGEPTAGAAARG